MIVASDIIVELPDILFDSIGDDPNLNLDDKGRHLSIKAYLVTWVSG